MGLFDFIRKIFRDDKLADFDRGYREDDPPAPSRKPTPTPRSSPAVVSDADRTSAGLAKWLGVSVTHLNSFRPAYRTFAIPKRSGGSRTIDAPDDATKAMQRRVLRRLLPGIGSHDACHGFECDRSIVTNALPHARRAVVVRMDLRDFFPTTTEQQVREFFVRIGWASDAVDTLARITCHNGHLPQGAPTSPRLANLVNYRMDARLAALAARFDARYTRYADDLTFSFSHERHVHEAVGLIKHIVEDCGYRLHMKRKLHIRHKHRCQKVTGLVVNDGVNLPRVTRRRLRAIEHRLRTTGSASLSESQLDGWRALQHMVDTQRDGLK